jgi:maltose-binding protein MalE
MRPTTSFISILLSLILFGCVPTPSPTAPPATVTPTPEASPTPAPTPVPTLDPNAVRVWLPRSFAPDAATPGGLTLASQLAEFQSAHDGITLDVRLKQANGPGGLLTAFTAAYNAAPAILPNLIVLSRDDATTAYRAGLLLPLDNALEGQSLADYYPFAQAASRVDNALVCLPFAVEARVLAYNAQIYTTPPLAWRDVLTGPLILPAAETSGLTVLETYLALGGSLASPSGQLGLETDALAEALTFFQALQSEEILPLSTLTYTDPEATWQVFRERRAALAVTSAQWYLAEHARVSNASVTFLPTRDGAPFALAESWCWALVNTAPEQQPLAAELLRWLNAPEQLGAWSLDADVLPPRAEVLQQAGWSTLAYTRFAEVILQNAQPQPSADVLARLGLPLRQALEDVLSGRATPLEAATTALLSLNE